METCVFNASGILVCKEELVTDELQDDASVTCYKIKLTEED